MADEYFAVPTKFHDGARSGGRAGLTATPDAFSYYSDDARRLAALVAPGDSRDTGPGDGGTTGTRKSRLTFEVHPTLLLADLLYPESSRASSAPAEAPEQLTLLLALETATAGSETGSRFHDCSFTPAAETPVGSSEKSKDTGMVKTQTVAAKTMTVKHKSLEQAFLEKPQSASSVSLFGLSGGLP